MERRERREWTKITSKPVKLSFGKRLWKMLKAAPVFWSWVLCSFAIGTYCSASHGIIAANLAAAGLLAIPFFLIGCFRFGYRLEFDNRDNAKLFVALTLKK